MPVVNSLLRSAIGASASGPSAPQLFRFLHPVEHPGHLVADHSVSHYR